jgi:hypothetical protein
MSNTTSIQFSRTPLPDVQWDGDFDELIDLIVAHLIGDLENGAFTGQDGGTEPTSNVGLWFHNFTWYAWDEDVDKYLPLPVVAGRLYQGALRKTHLISGATTGDVDLFLPDQNGGTIATLDDLADAAQTTTLDGSQNFFVTGGGSRKRYYIVVLANISAGITGFNDGDRVDIWLEQPDVSPTKTVTWTPLINWMGGSPPVLSAYAAGHRKIDRVTIWKVEGLYFGEFQQGADIPTAGGDTTAPTVVSFFGAAGLITLTASESLRGKTVTNSEFVVKKNGTNQTINTITVSGKQIVIDLAATFTKADVMQVQYVNSLNQIKDLAGNNMVAFGLHSVVNGSNTTGSGGGGFDTGGGLEP